MRDYMREEYKRVVGNIYIEDYLPENTANFYNTC
jgi:hypothetical protein